MLPSDVQELLVRFRASTILAVLGIAIAVAVVLEVVWIARQILTWILIAVFFALALNPLVDEVNGFVRALPGYIDDLTHRRGRLGFLESKYHVSQRVRDAVQEGGATRVLGLTGTALAITKGIITAIVATVTILFMTFFMLLEGPAWLERFYGLLPDSSRERWRGIGRDIYRTVGGYVTGNLLISVIAGSASAI